MNSGKVILADLNNSIPALFEYEVNTRLREEYSLADETEIMNNMLLDSSPAEEYSKRLREIRLGVKNEIETILSKSIDVKYDLTTETEGVSKTLLSMLGENKAQYAEQFRRAVQLFADSLAEDTAMEIAAVYDEWEVGKAYKTGNYLRYGTNGVGDPQLYKVVQDHTSQADWTPDAVLSLYVAIGLDDSGYPVWSKPTGAHDAYNKGDIVNYNGVLKRSLIDGNVYSPDEYPAGWEDVE